MVQKITLIGNVGREPESRFMPDGSPVATFALATNRTLSQKQQQQSGKKQETTWFRVTCYGPTADYISKYAQKGAIAFVEGRLICDPNTGSPKVFQRSDGTWGAAFDVSAEVVRIISGYKTFNNGQQNQAQPQSQPQKQQAQQPQQGQYDFPDDLPF